MSQLYKTVDSLEDKLIKLLKRYESLQHENQNLVAQIQNLEQRVSQFEEEVTTLKETKETLQNANAILGSDQYKRDTKLKINALVRELDYCITQLSE